jgi:translation elongation factor P/translation initiation factor 5A
MEKNISFLVGAADIMATMAPVGHLVAAVEAGKVHANFKSSSACKTVTLKRYSLPVISIITDQANFFDNTKYNSNENFNADDTIRKGKIINV